VDNPRGELSRAQNSNLNPTYIYMIDPHCY
jgi:hypothetical protein